MSSPYGPPQPGFNIQQPQPFNQGGYPYPPPNQGYAPQVAPTNIPMLAPGKILIRLLI